MCHFAARSVAEMSAEACRLAEVLERQWPAGQE